MPERPSLARFLDHTLLGPRVTRAEIERLCAEALEHGFASVCVHGVHVPRCARALSGSAVAVGTVVGFPLGASATAVKLFEARQALEDGATELDAVLPLGALAEGDEAGDRAVREELAGLCALVHRAGGKLKAILETALLSEEEKVRACRLACEAGVDFVKTSTGFQGAGASVADVRLLRRTAPAGVEIKASGGIRTPQAAWALIEAGATRLGTSWALTLVGA